MNFSRRLSYFWHVILRQNRFLYNFYRRKDIAADLPRTPIIGMIRERNEELLLQDTLDHFAQFVDAIVVFDDASTDASYEIACRHPAVVEVVQNKRWNTNSRAWEETSNRRKLHSIAKKYNPEWLFYIDADERYEGNIKEYLLHDCPDDVNAIRISLFDSYITDIDQKPYEKGSKLYNYRSKFGPEVRDIIMIWRNLPNVNYHMQDAREPQNIQGKQITKFYCQHYGKSLSLEHWEETCEYYIKYFPKYSAKWMARRGKAVHSVSDFGRPLYSWEEVKKNSVRM